jgi:hypothetical protein
VPSHWRLSWWIGLQEVHHVFACLSQWRSLFPHAQEAMSLLHLLQSEWVLSVRFLLELAATSKSRLQTKSIYKELPKLTVERIKFRGELTLYCNEILNLP